MRTTGPIVSVKADTLAASTIDVTLALQDLAQIIRELPPKELQELLILYREDIYAKPAPTLKKYHRVFEQHTLSMHGLVYASR